MDSVLGLGRSKCHFLAFENGHFCQKCPFSSAKKWHFERPDLRTDSIMLLAIMVMIMMKKRWYIKYDGRTMIMVVI